MKWHFLEILANILIVIPISFICAFIGYPIWLAIMVSTIVLIGIKLLIVSTHKIMNQKPYFKA